MYKNTFKSLLILLLIFHSALFAEDFTKPSYDLRLNQNQYGKIWYDHADTDYEAAYNIGVFYDQKLKDYKWAEFWYKKSWSIKNTNRSSFNLAILLSEQKQYQKAIGWYKKAISFKDKDALNNLGYLYDTMLKDYKNAETWYKKAIREREFICYKKSWASISLYTQR